MAVTADLVRYARQLHRDGVIGGSEFRHDLVELLDVVFDQLPLVPPFVGLAEDVERATAQSLELCEHLEGGQHPGAELPLLQFTGNGIALGDRRRREVVLDRVAVFELRVELRQKCRVGVQPRDFELVLVGHQLVQVARNGFGEAALPWHRPLLGSYHALDHIGVALRVGLVLILDQIGHPHFEQAPDLSLRPDGIDNRASAW